MSAKLMAEVWELDLPPGEAKVLQVLCDHADHVPDTLTGINIFPAVKSISWKTNYDRRQVQRCLRRLELASIVVRVATEPGCPIKYEVHLDRAKRKPPIVRPKGGGKMSPPRGGKLPQCDNLPQCGTQTTRIADSRPPAMRYPDRPTLPLTSIDPPLLATSSSFPQILDDDERQYVTGILTIFGKLPGTTPRWEIDVPVARRFWRNQIALKHVEAGLWLGAARRLKRSFDSNAPAEPISSLAYFAPIVAEIVASPPADAYTSYLRQKVETGGQFYERDLAR